MKWRDLSEQEAAVLPEARLGGSLLLAVVAAMLLVVLAVSGWAFAFERFRAIGSRYMIAVTFVAVLSALFVVMTFLRLRVTPSAISAGLIAWIVYRTGVAIGDGAIAYWPLLVDMLGEAVLAAGFCGYMASAVRPNAYYRRRVPTL
jgi:ABC-type maltose transport system permease subunit